ncbi:Ferrochelatase [Operophtera brumata]|uniref:Ferrochelatase n=1 Tax=Operophtera brumata TaxID=104452 RepID=A0A0L7KUP4_OPEBR|nr:Ferrochelatase [Operophtera brumata]
MDGAWYLSAVATDLQVQGDCAMVLFDHQNTLDVSIKWITNHTASYYNGSKTETYSFLDINYEHYAVVFACYNNEDGNSNEIWKMTRTPHLKDTDSSKLDAAIASYRLEDTPFITFNNTEDTCWVNAGQHIVASALVMTSAAAITLFRGLC